MNDAMRELMNQHEKEREEREAVYEDAVEENRERLRHRVRLANDDPGLNLDINDEYLEEDEDGE